MGVACPIEKLQRDFLLDGIGDAPKFHLVHWKRACEPIQTGGLGIHNLAIFNKALLGNVCGSMVLSVILYGEGRWIKNMRACGGGGGCWISNQVQQPYGVSLWKFIRAG